MLRLFEQGTMKVKTFCFFIICAVILVIKHRNIFVQSLFYIIKFLHLRHKFHIFPFISIDISKNELLLIEIEEIYYILRTDILEGGNEMEERFVIKVNLTNGKTYSFKMSLDDFQMNFLDSNGNFGSDVIRVENTLINPLQIVTIQQMEIRKLLSE